MSWKLSTIHYKIIIAEHNFMFFFRNIFSEMTANTFDFTGYYTVIFTEYNDDVDEIIERILMDFWSLYIANSIVLVPTKDYQTIRLFTFFPYTVDHCEKIKPVEHDYFVNGTFARNSSVFPNKFRNFHRCPLFVSSLHIPPYMILKHQQNGSIYTDGIEGTMLRDMSRSMNFTVMLVPALANLKPFGLKDKSNNIAQSKFRQSLDLVRIYN